MALTRITSSSVINSAVTETKLADGSVTVSKLASVLSDSFISVSGTASIYVTQSTTFQITNYNSATVYTVGSATLGIVSIVGDTITYTAGSVAGSGSFTVSDGINDKIVSVIVTAAGIITPSITAPSNGATEITATPTFTSSAFTPVGLADTHANSSWQIWTGAGGTGTLVTSSVADNINKTSWTVSFGLLLVSTVYFVRVLHTGTTLGSSSYSAEVQFTTASSFGGRIGTAGAMGFGTGNYVGTLPAGFSNTTGNTDVNNSNYGNYTYSDGSVMVFVPKFYYRIGNAASPRFAVYGANAIDIAGIDTFISTATANAAGYALHRCFIDGGVENSGFFFDKYKCSNGTVSNTGTLSGGVKSQFGGVPISLTTTAGHTRSQNYVTTEGTCTGILADAVMLARSRGIGVFNVPTIFMYSAIWMLQLAHGQAATGTASCAWYDAGLTTNFPKGCNNGSLADINDAAVTYTTAGDSASSAKPKTGATGNFNKTTHNGQANGIADLNGGLYEVMLGLTNAGSTATASSAIASNNFYVLKQSVSYLSLKGGWNTSNDAWQSVGNITTNYDVLTTTATFSSAISNYWGNSTNQVFSAATSGSGWLNTGSGLPFNDSSTNVTGTNLYGLDQIYKYNIENISPQASGYWSNGAAAGLGYRHFSGVRSVVSSGSGFRASSVGA